MEVDARVVVHGGPCEESNKNHTGALHRRVVVHYRARRSSRGECRPLEYSQLHRIMILADHQIVQAKQNN